LLGHNGAGKTTVIQLITGILSPTGGTASIYGHNL
jgi:ATP-binding cassette, subfamily A (ABC1), member 3